MPCDKRAYRSPERNRNFVIQFFGVAQCGIYPVMTGALGKRVHISGKRPFMALCPSVPELSECHSLPAGRQVNLFHNLISLKPGSVNALRTNAVESK
jgi:hypothetical protein